MFILDFLLGLLASYAQALVHDPFPVVGLTVIGLAVAVAVLSSRG